MPLYEYRCQSCGNEFTLMRPMGEIDAPSACPACGGAGQRLLSVFGATNGSYIRASTVDAFRGAKPAPTKRTAKAKRKKT